MATKVVKKPAKRKPMNGAASNDSIVKRIFTRDAQFGDSDLAEGREDGAEWVLNHAFIAELQHLEAYAEQGGLNILERCACPKCEFVEVCAPGVIWGFVNRGSWEVFFEWTRRQNNSEVFTGQYMRGFAEGALAAWAKLKPSVMARKVQETENAKERSAARNPRSHRFV